MKYLTKTLFLTVFLIFLGSPGFAHSELISTDPADGAVITELPQNFVVTYNEDLIPEGTFAVLIKDGSPIDLTAEVVANQVVIAIPSDLESGVYAVEFKTVAADGHPQEGVINFTYAIEEAVPVAISEEEEPPMVISPLPIEETDIVIEQPKTESASNLTSILGAFALVLFAFGLLFRTRSKNKG